MARVSVVVLFFFVAKAFAQNGTLTLAELPKGVVQELIVMLGGQKLSETVECVDPIPSDVDFLLYTRDNTADPVVLDPANPLKLDSNKRLIVIIHGWVQGTRGYGMQEVKDAYLFRYDANVVIVNWGRLAFDLYNRAVCKLPKVAKIVTDFLCLLGQRSDINLEAVHLVGHSLGGQMSGFIGQFSKLVCKQTIGQITALDPAGPLYHNAPINRRLDETDANFVSVMHTNGGILGYVSKCGHVDFFVNCGTLQPGCVIPKIDLNYLVNINLLSVGCPHFRAMDLMVEAVRTNDFQGVPCDGCPLICPPIASFFKAKTIMGETTPKTARGGQFVVTNFKSPYAIKLQMGIGA
ncbi:hypothetical protein PPYR_01636 [Photinus pyralis]|uniref:Lipase domain-containing protein n=2 Tax=Photinus pyralis TaxID=7054 RepID=A0A5N4B528_PHOPY|nr:lipase member H-A-like [Photinus pyralis]XP_031341469.1 lipase member H-A-like [Photinus pyralis]KAB0804666.1 hypothetical protein PPYR_01636 [Photinus pyralis]